MADYTLGALAQNDLEEIWAYTHEEWGLEQTDSHLQSLISRFDWLANSPYSGKKQMILKQAIIVFPKECI